MAAALASAAFRMLLVLSNAAGTATCASAWPPTALAIDTAMMQLGSVEDARTVVNASARAPGDLIYSHPGVLNPHCRLITSDLRDDPAASDWDKLTVYMKYKGTTTGNGYHGRLMDWMYSIQWTIVDRGSGGVSNIQVRTTDGSGGLTDWTCTESGPAVTDDQWHELVFQFGATPGYGAYYIDGSLVASCQKGADKPYLYPTTSEHMNVEIGCDNNDNTNQNLVGQLADVAFFASADESDRLGGPPPSAAPSPSPTPAPAASSQTGGSSSSTSAKGDPHLQNINGQRFDLMRPGRHVLLHIPRAADVPHILLRVEADVQRLGPRCGDMYFQDINITGAWVKATRNGMLQFHAGDVGGEEENTWMTFGGVDLKVVSGHSLSGVRYLNIYARHLGRAQFKVGGLLGEDDHEYETTPDEDCVPKVNLDARLPQDPPPSSPSASSAEATLA